MTAAPCDHELLQRYLTDRDTPCPSCGYNLRALLSGRCPECGLALRLLLQPAHPRFAPFVLGLIGLSAGFGFGSLLLVYAGVRTAFGWFGPRFIEMVPLVLLAAEGALLLWWSLARRRIRRWSGRALWTAAAGACALTTVLALMFFAVAH